MYAFAFALLFLPSSPETNLTKVEPIPRLEKAKKNKIVDRATLYNPNNSGKRILAMIIVKINDPNFITKVIEN